MNLEAILVLLLEMDPSIRRPLVRFVERVKLEDVTGCMIWQGPEAERYGRFYVGGRNQSAHRWLWELLHGPVPDGCQLHHRCGRSMCVNPHHLVPLTAAEHNRITHSPPIHCPRGHPYDTVNTRWYEGRRYCRTCNNNGRRPTRASRLAALHAERRA